MKVPRTAITVVALFLVTVGVLSAQRQRMPVFEENVPYDGRYTFVRVSYDLEYTRDIKWSHDYPRGERHFTKILSELTSMNVRTQESDILSLADPEIFKYPVLYLCEPGFWHPNDVEVEALRKYLAKGGFIMFDDFVARDFLNLQEQLKRVLPQSDIRRLDITHPIFDSFYRIKSLDYQHPYYGGPSYFDAIFEDNDPSKRIMVLINTNNDISEYWEFSDVGMFPIDASNEAYKLGINYLVYALTR